MKRIALSTVFLALVLAGGTSAASSDRPQLRIVDTDPLTVRGANFVHGEAVTVSGIVRNVTAQRTLRQLRTVRSGAAGGFTAVLRSLDVEGCAAIAVTATGASGDRASAKIMPVCPAP